MTMRTIIGGVALVMALGMSAAVTARATETAPQATAGDKVRGEQVYKELKCSMCHRIGNAGAKMGPELTKVGGTRDQAWLKKYLSNPKAENPKNKMPAVKVKTPADLDNLVAYMLSLK